jgi:hypothetical protein
VSALPVRQAYVFFFSKQPSGATELGEIPGGNVGGVVDMQVLSAIEQLASSVAHGAGS